MCVRGQVHSKWVTLQCENVKTTPEAKVNLSTEQADALGGVTVCLNRDL